MTAGVFGTGGSTKVGIGGNVRRAGADIAGAVRETVKVAKAKMQETQRMTSEIEFEVEFLDDKAVTTHRVRKGNANSLLVTVGEFSSTNRSVLWMYWNEFRAFAEDIGVMPGALI